MDCLGTVLDFGIRFSLLLLASTMGAYAVDLLCEGKSNRVVGYRHGDFVDFDIDEALAMEKLLPEYQFQVCRNLSV